jgi:hypothetical protein
MAGLHRFMNDPYPVATKMVNNLKSKGFAGSLLFTGPQTEEREEWLTRFYLDTLDTDALADHPDFYGFNSLRVAIGESEKPAAGTVRHFLKKFLPYPPVKAKRRIVCFPSAEKLLREAESALLKSIEEPPPALMVILVVEDPANLSDTIVSRCLEIPLNRVIQAEQVSQAPWERFWYLSGLSVSPALLEHFPQIKSRIQEVYQGFSYSQGSSIQLHGLGPEEWKKLFPKAGQEFHSEACILSFLPLQFMCRDAVFEGDVPTIAPERLPWKTKESADRLYRQVVLLRQGLGKRYFGTRLPNLSLLFSKFLIEYEIICKKAIAS